MALLVDSPGTVALPTSEVGRFAMFTVALAGTRMPPDTNLVVTAGASVTENINSVIRQLRDEDRFVWVLGDDHTWLPDTLLLLLQALDDNPDADIIVPLVLKRSPPFHLVLFHEAEEHADGVPGWQPFAWNEIPESGQFEVDAAGSAGMLIRRECLDSIGDPWFQSSGGVFLNEDVYFCARATALNHRIFATSDVTMGHLGIFNVRPVQREGRWCAMTEFTSPEEQYRHMFLPNLDEYEPVANGR